MAQADIERELRRDSPIVLHEKGVVVVAQQEEAGRRHGARTRIAQQEGGESQPGIGCIRQVCVASTEPGLPGDVLVADGFVFGPLVLIACLDHMLAFGPAQLFTDGIRRTPPAVPAEAAQVPNSPVEIIGG